MEGVSPILVERRLEWRTEPFSPAIASVEGRLSLIEAVGHGIVDHRQVQIDRGDRGDRAVGWAVMELLDGQPFHRSFERFVAALR